MIRGFGAMLVVASLVSSSLAYAAAPQGVLAPGKPAGVEKAQSVHSVALWIAGLGIIGGGLALAISGNNNDKITNTTTVITTTATSSTSTASTTTTP